MSKFRSLYSALKGWYCRPLADYPKDLREWIEGEFHSPLNYVIVEKPYRRLVRSGDDLHFQESSRMVKERRKATWDDLTPAQRLGYAKKWDYKHDPATKPERDADDTFYAKYENLQNEIAYWERLPAPDILNAAKREEILAPLKARFDAMDLKRRQMLGDPTADDAVTIAQADGKQDGSQSGEPDMCGDEAEPEQLEQVATDALAALFDPVTPAALEKMFPAAGGWAKWHRKAKEKGLDVARRGRGTYNPYLAALWWLEKQTPNDWTLGHCLKRLANNLPPRSHGLEYRLTGKNEGEIE